MLFKKVFAIRFPYKQSNSGTDKSNNPGCNKLAYKTFDIVSLTESRFKRQHCDVAIVGGGIGGLYMAESLLRHKKETNVCVLERDTRLGGRIYDHVFPQVPDVYVGELFSWVGRVGSDDIGKGIVIAAGNMVSVLCIFFF